MLYCTNPENLVQLLLIDNYDSFTYNLVDAFAASGVSVHVMRSRSRKALLLTTQQAEIGNFDGIVISAGPGRPENAGVSLAIIRLALDKSIPLLGVCLGYQAVGLCLGMKLQPARHILHGKCSTIRHEAQGLFENLPQDFVATRYHSLALSEKSLPGELVANAWADDGELMGLRHRSAAVFGVQFHPESVATPRGKQLLQNFVAICREHNES